MIDTLLPLLAAHLIGDFVLQTDWILARKREKAWALLLHVLIVTALSGALLANFSVEIGWILGVVFITHLVMDWVKARLLGDGLSGFAVDQIVHLAVIISLAVAFPSATEGGLVDGLPAELATLYPIGLATLSGAILAIPAGGHLIAKAITPIAPPPLKHDDSLARGGRYIGWLERAIAFMLVMAGQLGAVGFLIATKSILRFGETQKGGRGLSEYIIIGTFMSFGWALLVAFATQGALKALG